MNMLILSYIAQDIKVVSGIYRWGMYKHPVCKRNSRESFGQKQRLKEHKPYKEGF